MAKQRPNQSNKEWKTEVNVIDETRTTTITKMVPPQTTKHGANFTLCLGPLPSPLESELSCTGCEPLLSLLGGGVPCLPYPSLSRWSSGQSWLIRILQPTSHRSWFRGGHIIPASPMGFFPRTFEKSAFPPSSQAIKMLLPWSQLIALCRATLRGKWCINKQNGDSDQVQGCYINP